MCYGHAASLVWMQQSLRVTNWQNMLAWNYSSCIFALWCRILSGIFLWDFMSSSKHACGASTFCVQQKSAWRWLHLTHNAPDLRGTSSNWK